MNPKRGRGRKRTYAIVAVVLLTASAIFGILVAALENNTAPSGPRRLFVEVWNPVTGHTATGFIAVEIVYPQTSQVHESIPLNSSLGIGFSQGNYTEGQSWGFVAFTSQCEVFASNGGCSTFQSFFFGIQTIKPYAYDPDFYVVQLVLNSTGAVGH